MAKKILTTENEQALFEHFKNALPGVKYEDIEGAPTVPSKLAELEEDSEHRLVSDEEKAKWNSGGFSGDYNDLTNKPTVPSKLAELEDDSTHRLVSDEEKAKWNSGSGSGFSGDYNDLINKPTIPDVSGLATKEEVAKKVEGSELKKVNVMTLGGNYSGINANALDPMFDKLRDGNKWVVVARPQHIKEDGTVEVDTSRWINVFMIDKASGSFCGLMTSTQFNWVDMMMHELPEQASLGHIINNSLANYVKTSTFSAAKTELEGKDGETVQALEEHKGRTDNPHGVTKEQVGLGSVDNTSDKDKPVSTAMQAALDGKLNSDALDNIANGPNEDDIQAWVPGTRLKVLTSIAAFDGKIETQYAYLPVGNVGAYGCTYIEIQKAYEDDFNIDDSKLVEAMNGKMDKGQIVALTQAEYDALETKDDDVFYFIKG